jgi:hypothetical protein
MLRYYRNYFFLPFERRTLISSWALFSSWLSETVSNTGYVPGSL